MGNYLRHWKLNQNFLVVWELMGKVYSNFWHLIGYNLRMPRCLKSELGPKIIRQKTSKLTRIHYLITCCQRMFWLAWSIFDTFELLIEDNGLPSLLSLISLPHRWNIFSFLSKNSVRNTSDRLDTSFFHSHWLLQQSLSSHPDNDSMWHPWLID